MNKSLKLVFTNLRIFWKSFFMVIYPLALLPVFVFSNTSEKRCLYVLLVMAGFWTFEILPLPVTSMIPVALFPLMGILDTQTTCQCYFKEANMMYVAGLIIAIAVQYCNLHIRISLIIIKFIGCSYRRLSFGLNAMTMFVSMWISNTGAAAMMIPIIEATLKELENEGMGNMYVKKDVEEGEEVKTPIEEDDDRIPTNSTMCFFIGTAYASTIGGLGTIVGTGTNLSLLGIYDTYFPKSPGIDFNKWMLLNIPIMLVIMGLTWLWMQIWFMGMFRPNSKDALAIKKGKEAEEVARRVIQEKLKEMGPLTFQEAMTGIMFLLVIFLWVFMDPKFMPGWARAITDIKVKPATPAIMVVIFLFMIPAQLNFCLMCSKDEEKRPTSMSSGLLIWSYIQKKMHWGLVFLMGGGFTLSEAAKASKMGDMIADSLTGLSALPPIGIMLITCLLVIVLTQLITSNVAIANMVLPVVANMAIKFKVHPLYLMMPVGLTCSFAFCLPVSTPPNAIAAAPCNIHVMDMIKVGVVVEIIAFGTLAAIFPWLGGLVWDFKDFPQWANNTHISSHQ